MLGVNLKVENFIEQVLVLFKKYPSHKSDYSDLSFLKELLEHQLQNVESVNLENYEDMKEVFLKNDNEINSYCNITLDNYILKHIRTRLYCEKLKFQFKNFNDSFIELSKESSFFEIGMKRLELIIVITNENEEQKKDIENLIVNISNISSIEYRDDYIFISTNNEKFRIAICHSSKDDLYHDIELLEILRFYRLLIYNTILEKLF